MNINYLFVATVILFIFMIGRGYSKGFLRIVVTFIGVVAILIMVRKLSPYVSDYFMKNTTAYEKIQTGITEKFKEANLKYDNTIPSNQEMTINSYDLPDLLKNNLIVNNTQEMYKKLLVSVFEEYVSAYLAKTAVNAMSFVLIFIITVIGFKILLLFVDIISKIPIIKGMNQFLGALLGFCEALIIVWVFFFIVVMFIGNNSGAVLLSMISESKFLTVLFNTNILIGFIS